MNCWLFCVPLNVLDVANRNCRNLLLPTASSGLKKNEVIPSALASAKLNNCFGVRIWFEKGYWRFACTAGFFDSATNYVASILSMQCGKKNSIQPECASQFDEISGSLKFWSSYIVLLSHRWNKVFVQKWKLVSDVVFIKVFQKTVHHNCVMGLVVTYAHIRFMGKLTTAIHILYHESVYVAYELF